jgi:hypothetical protein
MAAARRPPLLSPFAFARRAAISRGVLGGNRTWLTIGGVVWAGRLVRKLFGRIETVAAIEVLHPGQFVMISAIEPPSRRARRAARRSAT